MVKDNMNKGIPHSGPGARQKGGFPKLCVVGCLCLGGLLGPLQMKGVGKMRGGLRGASLFSEHMYCHAAASLQSKLGESSWAVFRILFQKGFGHFEGALKRLHFRHVYGGMLNPCGWEWRTTLLTTAAVDIACCPPQASSRGRA